MAEPKPLVMGDILPNGATVIETRKNEHNDTFVICATGGNTPTPWASWAYHHDEHGKVHTYWGNYYKDLAYGLQDYRRR